MKPRTMSRTASIVASQEPERQAQGRRRDPRARRAHPHAGFRHRSRLDLVHQVARRQGNGIDGGRSQLLERACTPRSPCDGSTIKRRTAKTALARTAPRNFSAVCAAPKSAIIIISPASISAATPPSRWRDDHRRMSNGAQFKAIVALVAKNKPSVDFCGYWQGRGRPDTGAHKETLAHAPSLS